MQYIPYREDWFYSVVNIPNLTQIQTDFINLFWKIIDKVPESSGFFIVDQTKIDYPQSLYYLLDVLDLKDRWCSVNFSVINNGSKFGGIHYDFVLGSEKYLALNIPLLNCKNSFNVWYSGQPGEKIKIGTHSDRSQVILNKDDDQNQGEYTADTFWTDGDIFELKRVECDKPMLVHIGRPHQPEVIHTDLRVLLSLRFRPELSDQEFDYITSKYAM